MKWPLEKSHGSDALNKSSFEALLFPLNDESEVPLLIDAAKKEFPKADHYPYAYVLGDKTKSSDDGEPGGTAGRAFVEMLQKEEIDHCLVVVARFFGGVKLGTGNLRRCFVTAAKNAILNARLGELTDVYSYCFPVTYSAYQTIEKMAPRMSYFVKEASFEEDVKVTLESEAPLHDSLIKLGFREDEIPEPIIKKTLKEISK